MARRSTRRANSGAVLVRTARRPVSSRPTATTGRPQTLLHPMAAVLGLRVKRHRRSGSSAEPCNGVAGSARRRIPKRKKAPGPRPEAFHSNPPKNSSADANPIRQAAQVNFGSQEIGGGDAVRRPVWHSGHALCQNLGPLVLKRRYRRTADRKSSQLGTRSAGGAGCLIRDLVSVADNFRFGNQPGRTPSRAWRRIHGTSSTTSVASQTMRAP